MGVNCGSTMCLQGHQAAMEGLHTLSSSPVSKD